MTPQDNQTSTELSLTFQKSFFQIPIGAASPFWLAYMSAASAGAAYWWFSRLGRYTHLEAFMTPSEAAVPALEATSETVPEPSAMLSIDAEAEAEVAMTAHAPASNGFIAPVAEPDDTQEPHVTKIDVHTAEPTKPSQNGAHASAPKPQSPAAPRSPSRAKRRTASATKA